MDAFKDTINIGARFLTACLGGAWAMLSPAIPFLMICSLLVIIDAITAWQLSRRVRAKYPDANDGKFKSRHFGRVIWTLLEVYTLIVVAHLVDIYIFDYLPIALTKIAAGAVCLWQAWSVLENKSSCNDAKWAKVLQYVMVDKAERHFDVPLKDAMERAGIDIDGDGKTGDAEDYGYNTEIADGQQDQP